MSPDDPYPPILQLFQSSFNIIDYIPHLLGILVLISFSAMFSASENALFSLNNTNVEKLKSKQNTLNIAIIKLLSQPKKLLAAILIANNFVNVMLIIVFSNFLDNLINFKIYPNLEFIIKIFVVTFVLLLFGEVIPKIYAIRKNMEIASLMAFPLLFIQKIFAFIIYPLLKFSSIIDKRVRIHEHTISTDELSHAIDITSDHKAGEQEKEILKGIVNFGNKTVRQIMKGRMDVTAIDINLSFQEMLDKVNEWGYSRFPVYDDNFDNISGVLNIKEILPYINESPTFNWSKLLKPAFYVPDNKRIDHLLSEFQEERNHLAIVVDEYGGKLGIVTMEDILEEIFGEINDEFDDEQADHSKIDDNTFIVEGKLLINDFCKFSETEDDFFDEIKGETETVAGMVMEIAGKIPKKNDIIIFQNYSFNIESVDNRRINRIKISIQR